MRFHVRGENIQVTEAIREYVERKIGRLDRFFFSPENVDAHVTLRFLRGLGTIEVTIPLNGVILRAEDTDEDLYAAIDLVVDKLERQIRKYKTKWNRKLRYDGSTRELFRPVEPAAPADEEEEEEDSTIVRTKRFALKPMDPEEAVMQMDMLGHNFFVFQNSDTNEVNVVYRRKDGKYGLIEPM